MTDKNIPEHREAILAELKDRILTVREKLNSGKKLSAKASQEHEERTSSLRHAYFRLLPRMPLSQCPYCGATFVHDFDPWGVDGLWWQRRELRVELPTIDHCPHFVMMQGAVHLNGLDPQGGLSKSLTGPEQPFAAPRLLNLPGVKLVVSRLEMANGYTAFPLVYFAERQPPPANLMESWRYDTYGWDLPDGSRAWNTCTDPWEFDLNSWIDSQSIGWIFPAIEWETNAPAAAKISDVKFGTAADYPFANVEGRQARLEMKNESLVEWPLPQGEEVNPF